MPFGNPSLQLKIAKHAFGWEPHSPGQRALFCAQAPETVAACGRQWGKSACSGAKLLSGAIVEPNTKQYSFAPNNRQTLPIFKQSLSFLRTMMERCPQLVDNQMPRVRSGDDKDKSIIFPHSASEINFWSAGAELTALGKKGATADNVIVDEAGTMLEIVIGEVIEPMMLTKKNATILLVGTPKGQNHFYRKYLACKKIGAGYTFTSYDNPYHNPDFLQRKLEQFGPVHPTWRQEYLAEFLPDYDVYIPFNLVEKAMVWPGPPPPYDPSRKYAAGVDWAEREDFTVVWVLDITDPVFKTVFVDRFNAGTTDVEEFWTHAEERVATTLKFWNAEALLDSTGMGKILEERLVRRGCRVAGYNMNSFMRKQELVDVLRLKLERGQMVLPVENYWFGNQNIGQEFIDEVKHFQYSYTSANEMRISHTKRHHDDMIIALALANFSFQLWDERPERSEELTLEEAFWKYHSMDNLFGKTLHRLDKSRGRVGRHVRRGIAA